MIGPGSGAKRLVLTSPTQPRHIARRSATHETEDRYVRRLGQPLPRWSDRCVDRRKSALPRKNGGGVWVKGAVSRHANRSVANSTA